MISTTMLDAGVAEVVVNAPPVNALTVEGWFGLAEAIRAAGASTQTRAVILRAEGRGFNAGVDIKQIQRDTGHQSLIGANRGCFEAFAAVYECPVPVIVATHGYCLGGGIGLAGNADIIVSAAGCRFGLPEVDRGALGAATHLSRLVPQHQARAMMLLCEEVQAEQLHAYGSVYSVVPQEELVSTARGIAARIAAKHPVVVRAAKESLNGIDLWDVRRSYRYEQGFTFELNLAGVADEVRADFGSKDSKDSKASGDSKLSTEAAR